MQISSTTNLARTILTPDELRSLRLARRLGSEFDVSQSPTPQIFNSITEFISRRGEKAYDTALRAAHVIIREISDSYDFEDGLMFKLRLNADLIEVDVLKDFSETVKFSNRLVEFLKIFGWVVTRELSNNDLTLHFSPTSTPLSPIDIEKVLEEKTNIFAKDAEAKIYEGMKMENLDFITSK